jgi:ligand-binding SRPBCC domain-containing protein
MRSFVLAPIRESITVRAPLARCFALSTRIELVRETLGMNLLETGITSGHITAHSRVHWSGWKFGLPTHHHTLITGFTAPHLDDSGELTAWFQDSQERGRFAFFQHDHFFRESNGTTTLNDEVRFTLPFGPLGSLAASFLLAPHITRLARQRFARIKTLAEGEGWRAWTPG